MTIPKKYTFHTVKDIADAATEDNVDDLVKDIKMWLKFILRAKKSNKVARQLVSKVLGVKLPGGVQLEPDTSVFGWIDDGKHEEVVSIRIKEVLDNSGKN